jgi:hypothetical protein
MRAIRAMRAALAALAARPAGCFFVAPGLAGILVFFVWVETELCAFVPVLLEVCPVVGATAISKASAPASHRLGSGVEVGEVTTLISSL